MHNSSNTKNLQAYYLPSKKTQKICHVEMNPGLKVWLLYSYTGHALPTGMYYKRHMITVCCVSHDVVQPQLISLSHFVRVALQTAISDYNRFSMTYWKPVSLVSTMLPVVYTIYKTIPYSLCN
jgi:hypothetical protein